MKKQIVAGLCLLMAAALSSCSSENESPVFDDQAVAPVTVHTSGFEVSQQDFSGTRTAVGDYAGVKMLTLAFYRVSDNKEVYKHTQYRDDNTTYTTFGEFSTTLPLSSYTMVVLAYGGNNVITLTSPTVATYGENRVLETFSATQSVNITSTSALNLSATLSRIVSLLVVRSTDIRPAEVTHMRFTYAAGGKGFNPTTGLATSDTGFDNLMGFTGTAGSTTANGGYLFLATDEQTMDVTIETLNADGVVLFTKTVSGVPMKRNRATILTGAIYDVSAGATAGSFQVSESWLADYNMDI